MSSADTFRTLVFRGYPCVNVFTRADRPDCAGTPGSTGIAFYAINSSGVAAGWCTNTSGTQIGFTWYKGTFTDIHITSASLVNAVEINDAGSIVGTYVDSRGVQHGYLYSGPVKILIKVRTAKGGLELEPKCGAASSNSNSKRPPRPPGARLGGRFAQWMRQCTCFQWVRRCLVRANPVL